MSKVVIDGVEYAPKSTGSGSRVGVGITTFNRPEYLQRALEAHEKYSSGLKIVVVDDGSRVPVPEADFRFENNVGIAQAKNKCMELLADCDHIFLFDDDCWPQAENWWQPYIDSPEPHLMYLWESHHGEQRLAKLYEDDKHIAYHATCGVMLYAARIVLETVGGMDPRYGKWGFEHTSWSDRIHSAGLTTFRYGDVKGSNKLIYSCDEREKASRTFNQSTRDKMVQANRKLYEESRDADFYIEFRQPRDIILTHLLAGVDPQRQTKFEATLDQVEKLHASLKGKDLVLVTTGTEGDLPGMEKVTVKTSINPYFERHVQSYRYLRDHPEVRNVWCVDATDVEMLRDPFPDMEPGKLYVGWENTTLNNEWMRKSFPDTTVKTWIDANGHTPLVNAGVFGGDRETVMNLLHALIKFYFDDHIDYVENVETNLVHNGASGDMGMFNYVIRTNFNDIISTGPHVTTEFKAFCDNGVAWYQHK